MKDYEEIAEQLTKQIANEVLFDPEQMAYLVTSENNTLFAAYVDDDEKEIVECIHLCDSRLQ